MKTSLLLSRSHGLQEHRTATHTHTHTAQENTRGTIGNNPHNTVYLQLTLSYNLYTREFLFLYSILSSSSLLFSSRLSFSHSIRPSCVVAGKTSGKIVRIPSHRFACRRRLPSHSCGSLSLLFSSLLFSFCWSELFIRSHVECQ